MNEKLIIENQSDLSMIDCLRLVEHVIKAGRVSNKNTQYCYLTAFQTAEFEYHVVSDLNAKSDRLRIYKARKLA